MALVRTETGRRLRAFALATTLGLLPLAGSPALGAPRPFLPMLHSVSAPSGATELCERYPWACAEGTDARVADRAEIDLARRVNRQINGRSDALADLEQYGRHELWALPTARGGDCEDLALAKKKALVEAGLPPRALLISTVLDRSRLPHAVLILRSISGDLVLDNLSNRVMPWHLTDYSFIKMQDPLSPRQWIAIHAGGIFSH